MLKTGGQSLGAKKRGSTPRSVRYVDLELALRLDGAVRRCQAHVGTRPHALEDVARQSVVGAEVVG